MKDQRILFDTAKLAKKKGFDVLTYVYYNVIGTQLVLKDEHTGQWLYVDHNKSKQGYSAPTQSLLQKWLREVHNIRVFIFPSAQGIFTWELRVWDKPNNKANWTRISYAVSYNTYEEALEEGLKQALNLI